MLVVFSRTKNDPLQNFKYGIPICYVEDWRKYEIIDTKRGKMLKIQQKNKNWHDLVLARAFEITFTSEWVYIPMKYIMEIKEGASIEDYLESY